MGSSFVDDAASSVGGYSVEYATTKLRKLVEAQQHAYAKLQALAQEEGPLKERLRVLHSELHERIQREETNRVVTMLQDADSGSASQKDLVQRVRDMVAEGQDPESAQQMIVEELVLQSQDEVRRRVVEHFGPMRLEAEGELYSRQLSVAHELEALEAKAISLRGGTLCEEAKSLGFDFNLASQVRQNLRSAPSIRRTASVSSGSSAFPPRLSSAMSRVDSSAGSQAEVTTSNGARVSGKVGQSESPLSAAKRTADASAHLASTMAAASLAAGDSSPIRRLQQGQRVLLPNGMVAFAMPATSDNAVASPRRSMMPTLPATAESPKNLPAPDGSPRRSQEAESPSRRLASTSSLKEIAPQGQEGDISPRRRVQMSDPAPVEVREMVPDVTSQPPQGEVMVSPRQSMVSIASMGSYQAPPSDGNVSVHANSPAQQYRDKEASRASSRTGSHQVPVQALQSAQSAHSLGTMQDSVMDTSMVLKKDPSDLPVSLGGIARQTLAQSQPQLPAGDLRYVMQQAPAAGSVPTPHPVGLAMQPAMQLATQPALQPPVGSMTLPARPMMQMRPMQPQPPMQALISPRFVGPGPQMQMQTPQTMQMRPAMPRPMMVRPM